MPVMDDTAFLKSIRYIITILEASMSANHFVNSEDSFAFLDDLMIPPAAKAGRYQVRFAANEEEIHAAQALRYRVFYEEKHGKPNEEMAANKRDIDQWDADGFHIIAIDTKSTEGSKIVGTARLFHKECLKPGQHFYTEETFNLDKLHACYPDSVEISRFVIDPSARGGAILMLIWKYGMNFIRSNKIQVVFGCASFSGANVDNHLPILNYLYEHHLAPQSLCPVPKVDDYVDIKALFKPNADWHEAQRSIPTLLRGYIKLGAKISDAAIVDPAFNTVYVSVYVETESMLNLNPNLVSHA